MNSKMNLFLIGWMAMLSVTCSSAQKDIPEMVQKTFREKYPGEHDPDWHKDSNGNFESNFNIDGKSYRADFSPEGQWIETEQSIDKDDLPKAIRKRLKSDFSDLEITEIEEVDHHSKGRFYDIEFKQKGKNRDVEMREDGSIIE